MASSFDRFRKLSSEQLQRREMMAGDLVVAAIKLETLNMAGDTVSHVAVGEQFTLRASAKDLRSSGGVFSASVDVTFNGDLVQPSQTLAHSQDVTALRSGAIHPSQIDEAGGITYLLGNPKWMNVVLWEATFVAASEGEVVFASNPVEDVNTGVFLHSLNDAIDPNKIDFGFTRLLIGNGQPSPWTNPQNPADVNEDGAVTKADLDLLASLLGAAESVPLPMSGSTSFVDVDANRSLTIADLQLVRDQIIPEKPPVSEPDPSPDPSAVWRDEDFSFTFKNVRTGLTSGEIAEGDVFDVVVHFGAALGVVNGVDRFPEYLASRRSIESGTIPFTFDTGVLSATTPATVQFGDFYHDGKSSKVVPTTLSARFIAKSAGQATLKIDASIFPIFDSAINSLEVNVTPVSARPQPLPVQISLPFDDWTVADTSRVFLAEKKKVLAKFDAAQGVLANTPDSHSLRALMIRDARHGHVTLNSDGSFVYEPSYDLTDGDSFEYVIMSNDGTSTVQTAQLQGAYPTIVDLQVNYTNAAGEKVDRVKRGETFYVDVSILTVVGNGMNLKNPVQADFTVGSIASRGKAVPNPSFDEYFLSLGIDENGFYEVVTTVHSPTAIVSTNSLSVTARHFQLGSAANIRDSMIRIPIAAQGSGQFDLQVNKLVVGDLRAESIHLGIADLEVVEGEFRYNVASPLDVNADGQISPIDALLGINLLNRRRGTSARAQGEASAVAVANYYDSNGDGEHSPIDILLIINALNARRNPEGEQSITLSSTAVDQAFAFDIGETNDFTSGKRRSRR